MESRSSHCSANVTGDRGEAGEGCDEDDDDDDDDDDKDDDGDDEEEEDGFIRGGMGGSFLSAADDSDPVCDCDCDCVCVCVCDCDCGGVGESKL